MERIVGVAELLERDAHLVLREHPRHLRRVGVGGSGLVVAQLVRRLDVGAASDVIEVVVAVLRLHEHPLVVLSAGVGVVLTRRPDEVARVRGAVVEHATAVGIDDLISRELLDLLRCRLLAQGDGVELVALSRALGGVDRRVRVDTIAGTVEAVGRSVDGDAREHVSVVVEVPRIVACRLRGVEVAIARGHGEVATC